MSDEYSDDSLDEYGRNDFYRVSFSSKNDDASSFKYIKSYTIKKIVFTIT